MLIYFKDNNILFNLNGITRIEIVSDTDNYYHLYILESVHNRDIRIPLIPLKDKEEGLLILDKILYAYNTNQKVLVI